MNKRAVVSLAAAFSAWGLTVPTAAFATTGGTFAAPRYLATGSTTTDAVTIADVTGDGRPDIVAGFSAFDNTQTNSLEVFAQNASHQYGTPKKITAHGTTNQAVALTAGDIDGDGKTDIALADDAGVDIFFQRSGGLAAPVLVSGYAEDVRIADVTGDGRPDLVVAVGHGDMRIYPQTATHTFGAYTEVSGPTDSGRAGDQVFVADFNGDGRPDLAEFNGGYGTWIRLRQANGGWSPATMYQIAPDTDGYRWPTGAAAVGDVTGDGKADLVMSASANEPAAAVDIFAQGTGGLNTSPVVYPAYEIPAGLAIADLNGDGRKDVVVAHDSWRTISTFLQQSSHKLGYYTPYTVDAIAGQPDTLAVGDVTGDGKPDIVAVSYDKIAILPQK